MTRARLTIRARLTLLSTVLFATAGAVVIAITYALVAKNLPASGTVQKLTVPADFIASCNEALKDPNADANLRLKCQTAFQAGVKIGAQTQSDATLSHLLLYSGITLAGVTVLTAVASWFVVGRVLRRIQRITAAARTASDTNLSDQVALTGPRDEVYELAETFNDMLARLDASFAGQRRFIANASHELRTPLTVMRTSIDVTLAKPAPTTAELTVMAHEVREAVGHATELIEALLTLARTDRALTIREPVDLATVVEDVLDTTHVLGLDVDLDVAPARTIGDPLLLERLVANLVDNAVRYNEPGGRVSIDVHESVVTREVIVTIANTGPIVPVELAETLFEPFHRLNERTGPEGFGLGLAIAASIAAAHGGTLTAVPQPAGGLLATLTLPHPLEDLDHEAVLTGRSRSATGVDPAPRPRGDAGPERDR